MRTTMVLALGVLTLACGGSTGANDDDTGTTGGSAEAGTTEGPACTPGSEGCPCNDGACDGELVCFSQICVMPAALESSSSEGVESSTSSTGATDVGSESSSGPGETAAESESSSTTVAPVEACEEEGNHLCEDGVLGTCDDGELLTQSCADVCAQTGFLSPGCADLNGCSCAGFADGDCATMASKFCSCYALLNGGPCSDAFEASVYGWCFDPTLDPNNYELIACFGEFPSDTLEQCSAAADVCFNL